MDFPSNLNVKEMLKWQKLLFVIKCSMHDLIYDVIKYCTWSCNVGKISVYNKIKRIENPKGIKE